MGLAYLMPGHYLPWTAFEPQVVSAFGFALIASAACFMRAPAGLRPGLLGWTALALAFLPPLQWTLGQVRFLSDAALPSLYLVGLAMAVTAGHAIARVFGSRAHAWLFNSLAIAAGLSAAIAWQQWLGQSVLPMANGAMPGSRTVGNLAQPNHLSTLLVLGLIGVLDAFQRGRLGVGVTALAAIWLGGAVVTTQSRTGWLCMGFLAFWLLWQKRRASSRVTPVAVIVMSALFAALVMSWERINSYLLLMPASLAERTAAGTRLLHWKSLSDAALREPWWGYGWNQVSLAQLRTASEYAASGEQLTNAHNIALDLVLWCGLPMGLAVIGLLMFWIARQVRQCTSQGASSLLAAVVVISIHSLLEYPLDHAHFLIPWGIMIGMLDANGKAHWGPDLPRNAARGLVIFAVGLLSLVVSDYMAVDRASRALRLQMAGILGGPPGAVPAPNVRLLDALREHHLYIITLARSGMSDAELQWMRRMVERYPFPPAILRYAVAAGLNQRPAEAEQVLAWLCKIHSRQRCDEGIDSWRAAGELHPALSAIPGPRSPWP